VALKCCCCLHSTEASLKKQKINTSKRRKNLDDLIIVGMIGEREKPHQKKVEKLNELIEMRIQRKRRVKELMAKRAGSF
jgi:hypothetical protein